MKTNLTVLLINLFLGINVFSYSPTIKFILDDGDFVTKSNRNIGFQIQISDGEMIQTKGLLKGKIPWDDVTIIAPPYVKLNNGVMFIDHNGLWNDSNLLRFKVSVKHYNHYFVSEVLHQFPKLRSIEILPQMIYEETEFFPQIQGIFDNGRTYAISSKKEYPGFRTTKVSFSSPNYLKYEYLGEFILKAQPDIVLDTVLLKACYDNKFCAIGKMPVNTERKISIIVKGDHSKTNREPSTNQPKDVFVLITQNKSRYFVQYQYAGTHKNLILSKNSKVIIRSIGGNGPVGCSGGNVYVFSDIPQETLSKLLDIKSEGGRGTSWQKDEYGNSTILHGAEGKITYEQLTEELKQGLFGSFDL